MTTIRYANGPAVYLYDRANLSKKRKQLLWGDWLRIGEDINAEWSEVLWGNRTYAIKKKDYDVNRLLEIIFLDVGQGDGCIITTPYAGDDEKIIIVDAGEYNNMNGYLNYRFRDFKEKYTFHAAVISHPDKDHYLGFQKIFENEQISFENLYHNGIFEQKGEDELGEVEDGYITGIVPDNDAAKELYADESVRGGKLFPKLMWTALESDRFDNIAMLSTDHGTKADGRTWMPGFSPSDDNDFTIEILGPVVETTPSGKQGLRTYGKKVTHNAMDVGKTKNGHSVIMKLTYHGFSVLVGGDLNIPAEHFLLNHYGNNGDTSSILTISPDMVKEARKRFSADLYKCCHHGAADVTDEFQEAVNPVGFVVSSGDYENHVHPKPELLGLLGRKGRGNRPLILCSELLRSTYEKGDSDLRKELNELIKDRLEATDPERQQSIERRQAAVIDKIFKRNVGVYGAINLRTNGKQAVIAFRYEKPKGIKRWYYYELEQDADGIFQLKDKDR